MNGKTCRKAHLLIFILMGSFFWTPLALRAQSISAGKEDETALSSFLNTRAVKLSQDLLPPAEQVKGPFEFLNSLVDEALRSNPSIQAARKKWAAATKRPSQGASLPNPEVSFGSMSSGNLLPYSTIGSGPLSWASFMFKQKIPWPGKLNLKGDIAETEAAQNAQLYQAVTFEVIRQLKTAYFELTYIDQAKSILDRYRDLVQKLSQIAGAKYTVGEGLQTDVLRSQVEISLIMERLELLSQQRESAQARIDTLLNRSPDVVLPRLIQVKDTSVELPFSLETLYLTAREQNPEIEVERLEIQKASLQLDLAKKKFFPDLNISTSYMLRSGPFDNMYEYRVGLEIPLYFWRKERFGVEENVEEIERSKHSYQSKLQEVTFKIKDAYIGARTAQHLIRLYRQGIIPQATASLDSALSAYQVGSVDFLALIDNALTVLNYELQYEEETRDYFQSLARLEELLGFVFVK
ncbi:TolC family protein [Acidobacteria bacterium AH-259-D05]|nr:TolC family protein [Acidobacteria bacterium AH-259-D05]